MKLILIISLIFSHYSLSLPIEDGKVKYDIDIENGKISYELDLENQNYAYRVETSDGMLKHENGRLVDDNLVVEGSYEYVGSDGLRYVVTYTADEHGFLPKVSIGSRREAKNVNLISETKNVPVVNKEVVETTIKSIDTTEVSSFTQVTTVDESE